ncbi:unnamed protein product [Rhizophagus irregularis]|uniref:F-box domain-containing protein n=1 Tax=Rhizophagus irregularis TaxID=588596 RepID=A0A2I1FW85_9GLOM|nr:hypothetical protein RhiirA4_451665 [Rhizophagus irregularis]CAB4428558.1 unnamed protein product [Rhizophagus irregularis]
MSKPLPLEIIRPIVLYLKDDKKSLHSCLLVSRDWCRGTVNILWEQPFHFLYTCNNNKKNIITYSTSLSNLSNLYNTNYNSMNNNNKCQCSEKKRQLQATNLLITYLSIKYNNELIEKNIITNIMTKGENMMFNYFEFLKSLDLLELYSAIQDWIQWMNINKSMNSSILNSKINTIFNKEYPSLKYNIFEYFFTYSLKLKLLSFDEEFILRKFDNNNNYNNYPCSSLIKEKLRDNSWHIYLILNNLLELKNPEIKQIFINLSELVFTTKSKKIQSLFLISKNCHNIQKLIIRINYDFRNLYDETNQLISLIESQKNLIYFELIENRTYTNEILKSLKEFQYNSLKTLILKDVFISKNDIILFNLKNLQELRFNRCIYSNNNRFNDEKKNDWVDLWLPNLKHLEVDFLDKYKEESNELYSILLRSSPLISNI